MAASFQPNSRNFSMSARRMSLGLLVSFSQKFNSSMTLGSSGADL
jgi:hypothetical protein